MMGGIKAQYDCIKVSSETDFTEDLKKIDVPTLLMHGEDNQIVPFNDAARLAAKLLKYPTTKFYPGFPHGMATTHPEQINADLLAFIRSQRIRGARESPRYRISVKLDLLNLVLQASNSPLHQHKGYQSAKIVMQSIQLSAAPHWPLLFRWFNGALGQA